MWGQLRYLPGVVTLDLDSSRCNGCGLCTIVCPHAVFQLVRKRSHIVDRDACMECGACARNCPEEAISVRPGVGCATAVLFEIFQRKKAGTACATAEPESCSAVAGDEPSSYEE